MTEEHEKALLDQLVELRKEVKEARAQRDEAQKRLGTMWQWLVDLGQHVGEACIIWPYLKANTTRYVGTVTGGDDDPFRDRAAKAYATGWEHGHLGNGILAQNLMFGIANTIRDISIMVHDIDPKALREIPDFKQLILNEIKKDGSNLYLEETPNADS